MTNPQVRVLSEEESVRDRIQRWQDYEDCMSDSQPGPAYSVADTVADEIYRSRKSMIIKGINTPDPRLDLRVSEEDLIQLLKATRREDDPLHLADTLRRRNLMISLPSNKRYVE